MLKDQLREKAKENKRMKENFDTLKLANDTLHKEVLSILHIEPILTFSNIIIETVYWSFLAISWLSKLISVCLHCHFRELYNYPLTD